MLRQKSNLKRDSYTSYYGRKIKGGNGDGRFETETIYEIYEKYGC